MTCAMSYETSADRGSPRGVLVAGIALVVLGMQMFIIQPGFVALFVSDLGLSETTAGYIASAEMSGIAVATILAAGVGSRCPWRIIGSAASILLVAGNVASAIVTTEAPLMASRVIAGFGSGLFISLGYAMVGQASDKDRAFGYTITAVLIYGALAIFALPTASNQIGISGLFLFFSTVTLLVFFALPFVPAVVSVNAPVPALEPDGSGTLTKLAALCAVMTFFLGQGVVWAYLGLIGLSHGIDEQAVNNGLTISQFSGIAGALSLVWFAARVPFLALIAIGCTGSILSLLALVLPVDALQYGASVTVFNFFANQMTATLMAMVAKIGRNSHFVQLAAALQMIGLAAGPAFSAHLVEDGSFSNALFAAAILFVVVIAGAVVARSGTENGNARPTNKTGIVRHTNNLRKNDVTGEYKL